MANSKFNLSKGENKKNFNLSKNDGATSKFNLSKEHMPNTTGNSSSINTESNGSKKSKTWLWLLIGVLLIIGIVIVLKNNFSTGIDKAVSEKINKVTKTTNEVVADLQDSTANIDELQSKVTEAQSAIDVAKQSANSEAEKQSVADAQAKVDKVKAEVENIKNARETAKKQDAVTNSPTTNEAGIDSEEQSKENNNSISPKSQKTVPQSVSTSSESTQPKTGNTKSTVSESANLAQGTIEEKARQVIRGDFGNGIDRKNALGSEYIEIQRKVNEMHRKGEF